MLYWVLSNSCLFDFLIISIGFLMLKAEMYERSMFENIASIEVCIWIICLNALEVKNSAKNMSRTVIRRGRAKERS